MTKLIFSLCFTISIFSQNNSEIFIFDVTANHSKIEIKNGRNISNNNGYDNQPSFIDDQFIVFASSRSEQTDIAKYDSKFHGQIWINSTEGGEYSPLKIPNKSQISAVRLDKDGKQRLYAYNLNEDKSTELIKDLVVAYYTWADENTVVSAVIEDENLNLYTTNIKTGINKKYASNVGRSFHKIPNSDLVSFISKAKENQWQIKSLNPKTGKIKLIANTISGVEDICWLNNKTLLSGKDNFLYKLRLQRDNDWKKIADVTANEITKITRLSTNTSGTKLLLVGDIKANTVVSEPAIDLISEERTQTNANTDEIESAKLVQRHIKAFNHRQLDELVLAFDTDVIVNRFPRAKMYSGRTTLRAHYNQFFKKNAKSKVKVINRITHKNMVIDEELITVNNTTKRQVTIYETDDDNIKTMTFISNSKTDSNPEYIVNEQLEAYNNKDLNSFVKTYSDDIKLFSFPYKQNSEGKDLLKEQYATLFENVPDLNAEIVNRIVIGNKVIDKEKVLIKGETFYAIAIYEIQNDLISRVTFIQ